MNTAVRVAVVAAVGNLLQGWDSAAMAGSVIHMKKDFGWEDKPTMEGLTVTLSLIGATSITMFSGGISNWLGRRSVLIVSSAFYIISGLLMLWSPNVYWLLFARLLDGFGIGLAVTFAPMYISEIAPPEVRGLLGTLPQFTYSTGLFLSYSFAFSMSLMNSSNWRFMLGFLAGPSLVFFALAMFYLPESPRWLLSKGRMLEAKHVLQRLRGREDVSSEMAMLVEGLEVGGQTTIEEYVIGPPNETSDEEEQRAEKEEIKLFSSQGLSSMVAHRVSTQSFAGSASHRGSILKQNSAFPVDTIVTLMDSVHEKISESVGSKGSMLFPNFASTLSELGNRPKNEEWDEDEDYTSGAASETDENLQSPLISRQTTSTHKSTSKITLGSIVGGCESFGIGSGWQLAWKVKEEEGRDGMKRESFKRIYLHEDCGSGFWRDPVDGEFIKAAALVGESALSMKQLTDKHPIRPALIHPSAKGPRLNDLLEPGVKHALIVGIGIQILQQFLGINAVLYYTPQILEQAGVQVLLSNMGISSASTSLLISAVMTMLMLPCIAIAMRLMDVSGRRKLLLSTNPLLTASLVALVIATVVNVNNIVKAVVSTGSVIMYSCFFVMGFGPIPNILCAEIFPTRVRGICIPICYLMGWICSIIVTYTLPMLLSTIGLAGVFTIFALVSLVSWAFVFFKVPETKGMPIEVIVEFFALGATAH